MVGLAPKWVRLAPNGTNPGLFQIRFQCIWTHLHKELSSHRLGVIPRSPLLDNFFFIDLEATVGTYELRSYGDEQ